MRRAADRWFREQGLPTFVPLRRWFTDLPRRVAPLVAWVTIVRFLLSDGIGDAVDFAVQYAGEDDGAILLAVLVVLILSAAAAWGGYLLVRGVLRRMPVVAGTVVATLLIIGCAAVLVWVGYATNANATVAPVFSTLLILVACALVTGMGGAALISWAARLAVRNASAIGHMASIALPVILMLVVFSFFSTEVWQMASALSWGSIGLLGLVFALLAGVVVGRVSTSELDDEAQAPTPDQCVVLLTGTPTEHCTPAAGARRPLTPPQRLNILLAMTFAQLVQALFFAALLGTLLIVIGSIAVPVGIVHLWVGAGAPALPLTVEQFVIGGATLPITVNLLKTVTLLSLIAALPFVFSAVSEHRYRERFFDPIMADMRRAIIARDALEAKEKD